MTFDVRGHLAKLRCRDTDWLRVHRAELVRDLRRLQVEELVALRVLDERGVRSDELAADDGVSVANMRARIETARAIESLPAIAEAAHEGALSSEQLAPVAQLADENTDREWASRARNTSPVDFKRMVRT